MIVNLQSIGLLSCVVNLLGLVYVMRRNRWFRPMGWVIAAWMIMSIAFYVQTITRVAPMSNVELNVLSSALRLQSQLSVMAMLIIYSVIERRRK